MARGTAMPTLLPTRASIQNDALFTPARPWGGQRADGLWVLGLFDDWLALGRADQPGGPCLLDRTGCRLFAHAADCLQSEYRGARESYTAGLLALGPFSKLRGLRTFSPRIPGQARSSELSFEVSAAGEIVLVHTGVRARPRLGWSLWERRAQILCCALCAPGAICRHPELSAFADAIAP